MADYAPEHYQDPWREQVRENSARHAYVYKSYDTVGGGNVIFEEPVEFGLWFSEMPMVSYGWSLTEGLGQEADLDAPPFPTGGVLEWRTERQGRLYIGAIVMAAINPFSPEYAITHHFTFAGIGIKNIPGNEDQ